MLDTRAATPESDERTLVAARMSRILEGSDFPALSRQIIDAISLLDDSASSLQRLANVVLREYSLTLSVVRTANTAHYRRTGRPIQSATHAMMMLGARTVRTLASSLLLFENYSKRSPVLKELMVQSLITANHARELSTRLERADAEEAHLCGMFRNLGEVLIACHFPDDYARIQERVHELGQSPAAAAHAVLGFRYEDLAVEVSRHWGMPDSVVAGIRARPGAVTSEASAITAFSHDLTRAIYHRVGEPDADGDAERAVHDVIERHEPHLKLSRDLVRDVVESALNEARELFTTARVPMEARKIKQLSDAARTAMGLSATPTDEFDLDPGVHDDAPGSPTLRRRLRQEVEARVDPSTGAELSEVMLLALEATLRGGPFDRVITAVLSSDRTRLVARSGLGDGVEALVARFDFPMSSRGGPVVMALQQRQPFYVPVDRAPTVVEARWMQSMGIAQFGVLPIIVSGTIVGCIYVDRVAKDNVPDRVALEYAKSISHVIVRAIEARRRASHAHHHESASPATAPSADEPVATLSAAQKGELVLRVLRGEPLADVAAQSAIEVMQLEQWRDAFLAGAMERLGDG